MEVTPSIRRLIHEGAPVHTIRERVRKAGSLTLREEGLLLAMTGKTSLEEVLRITHDENETSASDPVLPVGKLPSAAMHGQEGIAA
jgi:hypothetical protein